MAKDIGRWAKMDPEVFIKTGINSCELERETYPYQSYIILIGRSNFYGQSPKDDRAIHDCSGEQTASWWT